LVDSEKLRILCSELLKVVDMDIKSWFSSQGSYADGLKLYSQLPSCNATILKSFAREYC
jgi:hypothetical protein